MTQVMQLEEEEEEEEWVEMIGKEGKKRVGGGLVGDIHHVDAHVVFAVKLKMCFA